MKTAQAECGENRTLRSEKEGGVGVILRPYSTNILNPEFPTLMHGRNDCERVHNHIKTTVVFHLKGIRDESRELYMLLNFTIYQLLLLVGCEAGVENPSVLSALI